MSDRETFYVGDKPIFYFEVRLPNPYRYDDPNGVAGEPIDAWAEIFNATDGVLLVNEDDDTNRFPVEITPMDEANDRGAVLKVSVPAVNEATQFTIYVRHEYEDGLLMTDDYRITISEYR